MAQRKFEVFAIKADVRNARTGTLTFDSQKTMYGGRDIAIGDTVFVFTSQGSEAVGLVARGIVMKAAAIPKKPCIERQTPRVSVSLKLTKLAKRPLGRSELKAFTAWKDGRPETELNFKFYRQATAKIVGITAQTAAFLDRFF